MDILKIEPTKNTPEVILDSNADLLSIKGESYPENTSKFYAPIFSWLSEYLSTAKGQEIKIEILVEYFNSSSSKALIDIFDQ